MGSDTMMRWQDLNQVLGSCTTFEEFKDYVRFAAESEKREEKLEEEIANDLADIVEEG